MRLRTQLFWELTGKNTCLNYRKSFLLEIVSRPHHFNFIFQYGTKFPADEKQATCWLIVSDLPFDVPRVWSLEGPVFLLGVLPFHRVQSNWSRLDPCRFSQPQKPFSNEHVMLTKTAGYESVVYNGEWNTNLTGELKSKAGLNGWEHSGFNTSQTKITCEYNRRTSFPPLAWFSDGRRSPTLTPSRLLLVCFFFSYGTTSVKGNRTHNCGMDDKRVWSCVTHPVSSFSRHNSSRPKLSPLSPPYREKNRLLAVYTPSERSTSDRQLYLVHWLNKASLK